MKKIILFLLLWIIVDSQNLSGRNVVLKIFETTDVHGHFFPYDFINNRKNAGGLARLSTIVNNARKEYGDNVLLFDNGDILQGEPTAYYYNYVDTVSPHLVSQLLNYMGYNAGNVGNHDVETGRKVFERWIRQCDMPVLGANILDKSTGKPLLPPYVIIERDGVKVAVLGMITPAIPAWLPEDLWEGLEFEDMRESAEKWIPVIKEKENPDLVIGLFHAGDSGSVLMGYNENASLDIARNVPGFDIILYGHDHKENNTVYTDGEREVLLINPANRAMKIAEVTASFELDDNGKVVDKKITGEIVSTDGVKPDPGFMSEFKKQIDTVRRYSNEVVGYNMKDVSSHDAFFGSSGYVDFIHGIQLDLVGADVSFSAPLTYDALIKKGKLTNGEMFNLIKYENYLYALNLYGKEIKDYLEESYDRWINTMKTSDDPFLILSDGSEKGEVSRISFVNPTYNFDSAAGIIYTVDVTKPRGSRITIALMADGTPFDHDRMYRVAVNSYRANGGGSLFSDGAGLSKEELDSRIVMSMPYNIRHYVTEYIKKNKKVDMKPLDNWRFVPEEIVAPAAERDYKRLFGE